MQRGVQRWLSLSLILLPPIVATPVPCPAQPSPLKHKLDSIASAFHGVLGYCLHNLKTGESIQRLGDTSFPSASTIKLAILVAAMEKQQQGSLDYDAELPFTEKDRQYGTGVIQNYRAGGTIPVRQLVHLMIAQSDNTAAIMLGQKLGRQRSTTGWHDTDSKRRDCWCRFPIRDPSTRPERPEDPRGIGSATGASA